MVNRRFNYENQPLEAPLGGSRCKCAKQLKNPQMKNNCLTYLSMDREK